MANNKKMDGIMREMLDMLDTEDMTDMLDTEDMLDMLDMEDMAGFEDVIYVGDAKDDYT
jgi:hypothetical protein